MMVSDAAGELVQQTLEEIELNDNMIIPSRPGEYIRINIPASQDHQKSLKDKLLDFLKSGVSRAASLFHETVDQREEVSVSVPSRVSISQHFNAHIVRRINLPALVGIFKEWVKHPKNAALLVWSVCVAISATMLGLLLLGLLNKAFPTRSSRNRWIEINNQVLNALFTLMSLYQHPHIFHHLVLLFRWRTEDIIELRKIYCKDGAYRHHEWAHMMLVVLLLHITCFAQYLSCSLYWTYSSKLRPVFADNFFFALGTIAPITAGLYSIYSPLGREVRSDTEEELHDFKVSDNALELKKGEWNGGLFDLGKDRTGCLLSFFCMYCTFGWNMERLGFGNMYVHAVTFFLLCVAPFWIFGISGLNISNDVIRDIVGISGLVLCLFGLLYGGFWRIQMRRKFGLPGNSLCCGSDSVTDYVQWMFCWGCSLAQEMRTVNSYDVEDDSFHRNYMDESNQFLEINGHSNGREDHVRLLKQSDSSDVMVLPPIQASIQSGEDEIKITPASYPQSEIGISDSIEAEET